ncbi:MAG: hypothetical protein GY906_35805 [bacterium]|nr:hypothetical protein [bacterium]
MTIRLRGRLSVPAYSKPSGRNILVVGLSAIVLISALVFYRHWIGATETCNPCLELPKTWSRTTLPSDGVFITVHESGTFGVWVPEHNLGRGDTLDSLGTVVARVAGERQDHFFFIRADASLPYRYIDTILEGLCTGGARKVFFITNQLTIPYPPEELNVSGT